MTTTRQPALRRAIVFCALLSAALLAAPVPGTAQAPGHFKIQNYGNIFRMAPMSQGGYVSVGIDSLQRLQVARWNSGFEPQWKYTITDSMFSQANTYHARVTQTNDGNFVVMHSSSLGSPAVFVIKFSPEGTVLWQRKYAVALVGGIQSFALSAGCAGDNGFLFGGGQCSLSGYVIKCDATGNIEWQYEYLNAAATGVVTTLNILPQGNHYVVGASYNANTLMNMKISATGDVLSYKIYKTNETQLVPFHMVALPKTGGFAVLADHNSQVLNQQYMAILDSNLVLQKSIELHSDYIQYLSTGLAVFGAADDIAVSAIVYDTAGVFHGVTACVSQTGAVKWSMVQEANTGYAFPARSHDAVLGLAGGGLAVAGYDRVEGVTLTLLDSAGNGFCTKDPAVLTVTNPAMALQGTAPVRSNANAFTTTGTYTMESSASPRTLYCGALPNAVADVKPSSSGVLTAWPLPADQALTLVQYGAATAAVQVLDALGRQVYAGLLSGGRCTIETAGWPDGAYLVVVRQGAGPAATLRISVAH